MFDQGRSPYSFFDHYEAFYRHVFPTNFILSLLTCGGKFKLQQCEFAFSVGDSIMRYHNYIGKQDKYDRYLYMEERGIPETMLVDGKLPFIFNSESEFSEHLETTKPPAIHFGAIYPNVSRVHEKAMDVQLFRPLVFDLDLNDYEREFLAYCHCGSEKKCCEICWDAFMRPAFRVMMYFLQDVMDFKMVLPVYSGRRGMHIWVFDERVWNWTSEARATLVNNLILDTSLYSPHFREAIALIRQRNPYTLTLTDQEVYDYFYPKLDLSVTTELWHLSKIPFSPHQETGLLCLPIGEKFNPRDAKHYRDCTPRFMEVVIGGVRNLFGFRQPAKRAGEIRKRNP